MVLFAVEWMMWAVSLTDASSLLQLVRHKRRPSTTKLVPPFQGRQVLVRTYEHTYLLRSRSRTYGKVLPTVLCERCRPLF